MFPSQAGNLDIEALSGICGYVSCSSPSPLTGGMPSKT